MTKRHTKTVVPYSAGEMFDLVADVERYPEFLPHCVALRVLSRDVVSGSGVVTAEMVVAYGAFRERFKSLVRLDRAMMTIEASYIEGPFRSLHNFWRFAELQKGSEVDFVIDFEFNSFLLQAAAAAVFERAFEKMSDAFVARAHEIYGTEI